MFDDFHVLAVSFNVVIGYIAGGVINKNELIYTVMLMYLFKRNNNIYQYMSTPTNVPHCNAYVTHVCCFNVLHMYFMNM